MNDKIRPPAIARRMGSSLYDVLSIFATEAPRLRKTQNYCRKMDAEYL